LRLYFQGYKSIKSCPTKNEIIRKFYLSIEVAGLCEVVVVIAGQDRENFADYFGFCGGVTLCFLFAVSTP
jgi:hypothetical protein